MTNLWTVLYFTLGISLTGMMLVIFKKVFQDKLNARWHYLVWLVLLVRAILPANVKIFSTGFALNNIWMEPVKKLRGTVEMGMDSLLSSPFGMGGGDVSLLKGGTWSLTDKLFVVYVAGVVLFLLYDILVYAKLRRDINKGREASPSLKEKIRNTAIKYDLPGQENIKVCGGIETPFLCGFFKPILVIPENMEETIDEKVLLHEMLHLKHHDVLVNFALHVLQALNWFNPFVYWLCGIIRNDSEALCDQRALEKLEGEEKREYGMLLLHMADSRYASRIGTTSMANGAKNIKTRIQRIVDFGRAPKGAAFATGCITVMLCLASVSFAYEPKYFDTSGVETKEELELLLEDARYFNVTSPEMAISIFYEAISEGDLGKLALTVPQNEFEAYKAWALQEYEQNKKTFAAQLGYGTKADYKYRFYDDMRYDGVYFFDRQTDGAVTGVLHIVDETEANIKDIPVTERFQYFRVFEENKGNWSVELLEEEHWLFDVNDPGYINKKLREKMEQGEYTVQGDWKIAETAYCDEWGIGFSGWDMFSFMNSGSTELQFNESLTPMAAHSAYLEYTGTALKEETQVLVIFTCPAEITKEELWDGNSFHRDFSIGTSGSSSAGYEWDVIETGPEWDGKIYAHGDKSYENLEEAFRMLSEPYEVRIYSRGGELLETFPLKGGVLYDGK
ncbi:MAG: M56 family metallopeptidase [Anaerotignum sp.]|nr:M56 family metallopeptidase [Anaerotignum sp.]